MGKKSKGRKYLDSQAVARTKLIKSSVYKLNLVAGLIRGLKVQEAVLQLKFSPKKVSEHVLKTLNAAIANAENNHSLDIDNLIVKTVEVNKALLIRRFAARARGRGSRIIKPFCNLLIVVEEIS